MQIGRPEDGRPANQGAGSRPSRLCSAGAIKRLPGWLRRTDWLAVMNLQNCVGNCVRAFGKLAPAGENLCGANWKAKSIPPQIMQIGQVNSCVQMGATRLVAADRPGPLPAGLLRDPIKARSWLAGNQVAPGKLGLATNWQFCMAHLRNIWQI